MTEPDWKERIAACESAGMSRREIAAAVGMSYSALCDVVNGNTKEPRGLAAVKLHALAQSLCPDVFGPGADQKAAA